MIVRFRGCFFVVHEKALNIHERNIRARFVKFRGCFFCVLKQKKHFKRSAFFVGEGGLEPPNSSEDRFTVCCNCHYATPPNLSLRTCLKKTMQRYDLFLNFQQKNKLFLKYFLSVDCQYIILPFVTDNASKKPTALPPGYMFVATLYGIPIIGLDPKLLIISVWYVMNSGLTLYMHRVTLSPSSTIG